MSYFPVQITQDGFPVTIPEILTKLDKGGFNGTAETLDSKIDANLQETILLIQNKLTDSTTVGSITPSSVPPATGAVHGFATEPGTYTNWGGVIVPANSFAVISRDILGVFSISKTNLDITSKINVTDIINNLTSSETTKPLSAQQGKLLNDAKANLVIGKNLFNKATTTDGYYLSNTNVITALSGYCYSDYIAVVPGTTYKPSVSLRFTTFYDANKSYVSGGSNVNVYTSFVIPSEVYFIRFTLEGLALKNTCQFELGNTSTTYSSYKLAVPSTELELSEYAKTTDLSSIITPLIASKADLVVGKNIFNKATTTDGYYLSNTNVITALSGYCYSDYIAVVPGTTYKPSVSLRFTTFYDANKSYVSGGSNVNVYTSFVIPSEVYFIRFTLEGLALKNTCQFELGNTSTTYSSYKLAVPSTELELSEYAKTTDLSSIITPLIASKADLVVGKNLFNYLDSDVKRGFYLNFNGLLNSNSLYSVTGFIPVTSGQILICNLNLGGGGQNCFYDINKNFIAGTNTNTAIMTAPVGSAYVRYSLNLSATADIIAANIQVELGTISTTYEAYGLKVAASKLNLTEYAKTTDLSSIITPLIASKADLVVGKNLFNYLDSDVKRGFYLNSNGTTNPFSTGYDLFSVTGFIPVTSGQTLICNKTNVGSNTYNCFYNANKVFISGVTTATMVVPTGAAYVRYTLLLSSTADIISAAIQVELGTASTTYSPYKLVVDATELELTEYIKKTEAVEFLSPTIDTKILQNNLSIGEYINLFNKNTITVGYFPNKNTGVLQANPLYSSSDYMPVTAGLSYYNGSNDVSQSACYDNNKVFISGFTTRIMVMPANAYYVRIMVGVAYYETTYFTKGTTALAVYVPYKYTIKNENINFPTQTNYSNKMNCPLKQHFLSTIENNIYLGEFQKRKLQTFPMFTTPSIGTIKNDIIRSTNPTTGTYSVLNAMVDLDYVDVVRKDYSIVVSDLSKTNPINVLSIGDSYTDIGTYVSKISATIPNVTHVGMCKKISGTDVKREGRSGWTLNSYATQPGSTAGTGFFSPFLHPLSPYTYYGNTDFWKKVYIGTAPGYEIDTFKPWLTTLNINSSGIKETPTVNDVMYFTVDSAYKYWDGAAWIVISSATLGFTFNFPKYLTTWSIPTPDVITVLLGMNDFRSQPLSTFSTFFITWKSQMDTLIASAKLANANVKIVIATCNSTEYNDLSGKANAALWEGYNSVITAYDNKESENIFISDTKASVDNIYGYSGTKAIPFSNYTGSETIWYTGGDVHLNTGGMNQIGEKLAATIQYAR